MFSSRLARTTLRAARPAHPSPTPVRSALLSTRSHPLRQHAGHGWKLAGVLGAAAVGAMLWELKPELMPTPTPLYLDAPSSSDTYLDPTTSTPFASKIDAPDGTKLRLVGTGVRVVSFLSIRVYTVGWYVSEREFEQLRAGKLEGWKDYTPQRLLPPYTQPEGAKSALVGEELIENLLEKADVAVVIIPLRNTGLGHLRDAFTRALLARLKVPRVIEALSEEQNEVAGTALVDFKAFFPPRNLPKGSPLELFYSAVNRTVTVQAKNDKTGEKETLGTLKDATLSRELMVSYFSNTTAPSQELVQSVAKGLAGEGRP